MNTRLLSTYGKRARVCVCLSSIGLYVVSPHGDAFKDQGEKDKVINSQINQTHLAESHVNGWLFMSLSDRVTQVQVGSGLRTTFPCICCVPFLLLLSVSVCDVVHLSRTRDDSKISVPLGRIALLSGIPA